MLGHDDVDMQAVRRTVAPARDETETVPEVQDATVEPTTRGAQAVTAVNLSLPMSDAQMILRAMERIASCHEVECECGATVAFNVSPDTYPSRVVQR